MELRVAILVALFAIISAEFGPPFFKDTVKFVAIDEFSYAEVLCRAEGDPEPTYKWYNKYTIEIGNWTSTSDSVYVNNTNNGSLLVFESAQRQHDGVYTCMAKNMHGLRTLTYEISITYQEGPPSFDTFNETVEVVEDEYAEILCAAKGSPSPTYTWTDTYGNEIPRWSHNSMYSVHYRNSSLLVIRGANTTSSGVYVCTANNTHGQQSKYYNISIISTKVGPPTFENATQEVNIIEGRYSEVLCRARGSNINYTWINPYGFQVLGRRSFRPVYSKDYEDGSSLVFNVANRNHTGTYTCIANNTYGQSEKYYRIFIESDERNETFDGYIYSVQVLNVTESSVAFAVYANGTFIGLSVKYNESLGHSSTEHVSPWTRRPYIEIGNLTPSGNYTFEFRMEYFYNMSEWQKPTTVVLFPAQPEVIINGLKDGLLEITWIKTYEDFLRNTIYKWTLSYQTLSQFHDTFVRNNCSITIDIPTCISRSYQIAGLRKNVYYELQVRAHTSAGAGKPYVQKLFLS